MTAPRKITLACASMLLLALLTAASPAELSTPPRINVELALDASVDPQKRPGQAPSVALALALSGGGMRAANFALGVMLAMESEQTEHGNQLLEVDYLSTVSGGGFAAAAFLAARYDYLHHADPADSPFRLATLLAPGSALEAALRTGYGGMLTAPGCKTLKISRDRGHGFEQLLNDRMLAAAAPRATAAGHTLVLGDLFRPAVLPVAADLVLPQWFGNTASAESGALIPMTPDTLGRADITGYVHRCNDEVLHDPYALPWSVVLKASASLPGIIPETTLLAGRGQESRNLHLTDGGVSDNQGIITALEILREVALNRPAVTRRILIVVDAYQGDGEDDFSTSSTGHTAPVAAGRAIYLLKAAQRLNYRRLAESLAQAHGVELVYLSFSSIADVELREQARQVSTDLSISRDEQQALWDAGAAALAPQAMRIKGLFETP